MIQTIPINENKPFPNNPLPVLYYPDAIAPLLENDQSDSSVKDFFVKSGYTNSWTNGIFSYHHFHSNTHEVLACIAGEAQVQLGGPEAEIYTFKKGDVLLLPAGTAHKRIQAADDFQIVGAYPNGVDPDMQKGDEAVYEKVKENISRVPIPDMDPVEGENGAVSQYWE